MMVKRFFAQVVAVVACFLLNETFIKMENPLPERSVNLGGSVSIPCPLSTPGGSIQWLHNGVPVLLDPTGAVKRRYWFISPDGTASLTITDAQRKDAGLWECRELNSDGSVFRVARVLELVVGSSPIDPFLELEGRRLVHQATVTVREPQMVTIHCVTTGAVPPVRRIHWYIGDVNLTAVSQLFIEFSAEDDAYDSRSVLLLNVTRKLHRKELVCQVHHVSWLQAAAVSASLNVLYDPSFSISREPEFGFPIIEGASVSLRCEVDANPASEPIWVRDDGPLALQQTTRGFLNFSAISREHTGWYRCTTQHQFGHFASFSYFLNVRTADLDVSTAPEGKTSAILEHSSDSGCFTDGRPEVTAVNKSLMAIAEKSALLVAQLCSSSRIIRVNWIIRHFLLNPGDVKYPFIAHNLTAMETTGCYVSSLEIEEVRPEDAGEILLLVKNARGPSDASFHLNVTQASFSVSTGSSLQRRSSFPSAFLMPLCLAAFLLWSVISEAR